MKAPATSIGKKQDHRSTSCMHASALSIQDCQRVVLRVEAAGKVRRIGIPDWLGEVAAIPTDSSLLTIEFSAHIGKLD